MLVDGKQMRPIWLDKDSNSVKVIDQRKLPHELTIVDLNTVEDVIRAIKEMYVRGAPLIGVTGAFGVYIAALNSPDHSTSGNYLKETCNRLKDSLPSVVQI